MSGFDDWEVGGQAAAAEEKPKGPDELFAILGDSMVPPAASVEERPESGRVSQKGAAPPTSVPAEPSPLETALRSLPASVSSQFWTAVREPKIEEAPGSDAGAVAPNEPTAAPATQPTGADRDSSEAFVAAASEPAQGTEPRPADVTSEVVDASEQASEPVGTTTAVSDRKSGV